MSADLCHFKCTTCGDCWWTPFDDNGNAEFSHLCYGEPATPENAANRKGTCFERLDFYAQRCAAGECRPGGTGA